MNLMPVRLDPEIEEKYEILALMAEGGMGAVYKARHRRLKAIRVIKTSKFTRHETDKARFLSEAERGAGLNHRNVARIFDFDITSFGTAYIVMEYIDGPNVRQALSDVQALRTDQVVDIALQTLDALQYLHRQGFVHRDISPENLMLATDSEDKVSVKLIDLGIAKSLDDSQSLTADGKFIGKVKYAAPEQFRGDADPRSDLYSLGIVMYELLTGRLPFGSNDSLAIMATQVSGGPLKSFDETDPNGMVPRGLRDVVMKALQHAPIGRFESAKDFADALRASWPEKPAEMTSRVAVSRLMPTPEESACEAGEASRSGETPDAEAESANEGLLQLAKSGGSPPPPKKPKKRKPGSLPPSGKPPLPRKLGRFTLLEEITEGKTGCLYKAHDRFYKKSIVAIKIVAAETKVDEKRFTESAKFWRSMQHPHIVPVIDIRQDDPGPETFIVMEWVDGVRLEDFTRSPALTASWRIQIAAQICSALAHIHAAGGLHREVAPENILVVRENMKAMLLDPGIARPLVREGSQLTQVGAGLGNRAYIAPEQMRGEAEHRSDLFSLAKVLYFLFTNTEPEEGDIRAHVSQSAKIPDRLRPVLIKALDLDPSLRYESAAAFETALRDLLPLELTATSRSRMVVVLHGIRTYAHWQSSFSEVAQETNFKCLSDRWSFGYFPLIRLLLPTSRNARVKWFREMYREEFPGMTGDETDLPSIVAHSFGTYILGYALRRYDYLRFNKVILCGSILPTDFPWSFIIGRGQVQAVRNEHGAQDLPTRLVEWVVSGTGPSGMSGFSESNDRIVQRKFDFSHSEYFDKSHMRSEWIPFFREPIEPAVRVKGNEPPMQSRHPWMLYSIYAVLLSMAMALGWMVAR